MTAPTLTETDLRVLSTIFVHARCTGRMNQADYDRTVIVLAAARQRLKELANVDTLG